jgi:hypothetical protein
MSRVLALAGLVPISLRLKSFSQVDETRIRASVGHIENRNPCRESAQALDTHLARDPRQVSRTLPSVYVQY